MNQSVLGKLVDSPFCILFLPHWHPPTSGIAYTIAEPFDLEFIYLEVVESAVNNEEGNSNPASATDSLWEIGARTPTALSSVSYYAK